MLKGYCEGGQTMSVQTQNQKLLEYLKRGGKVTRWNALLDLGIANITARIADLRSQGHAIMTTMICRDGKRYGKWSLDRGAQE